MSKIIILAALNHGHVNPILGVLDGLVNQSENVIMYSVENFRHVVEAKGGICFRNYKVLENIEEEAVLQKDIEFDDIAVNLAGHLSNVKNITDSIIDEIKMDEPDLIVYDVYAEWGKQISRILGIPALCYFPTFAYNQEMFDKDPKMVIKMFYNMSDKYLENEVATKRMLSVLFKQTRKSFGMKDTDVFSQEQANIVFTSRQFQPHPECFDSRYKFVGPPLSNIDSMNEFPFYILKDKQVVYITMGATFNKNIKFYKQCIKAFKDSDKHIVISVGPKVNISDLGIIPSNFTVMNYVPQAAIMKSASLLITAGGLGTVSDALRNGVPIIVIPQGADQGVVAYQVSNLGAGINITEKEPGFETIISAVERIYAQQEMYSTNSMNLGQTFKDLVENFEIANEIIKYKNSLLK